MARVFAAPPALDKPATMDEIPWNRLHLLAAVCTLGGTMLDGYILGLAGGAIQAAQGELHLNSVADGLIGASALIGIFIGGMVFGHTADRWGRRPVFQWNLLAFVALSLLQLLTVGVWDLVAYRILLGLAIGVEYAVGAALLSEFVPTKQRGALLATLQAIWIVGFVFANFVGYAMPPEMWRVLLATSAIPAVIVLILRMWLPESPRWLAARGRKEEAEKVLADHFPAGTTLPAVLVENTESSQFRELFAPKVWRRTAYSSIFWAAQVGPLFAIFTFITPVLDGIGLPSGTARDVISNLFQLAGALVFIWVVARFRRRPVVIWTFAVMLATLVILGVFPSGQLVVLGLAAATFLFVASGAANLEFVYPSEMFETRLRSTGVGFAAAMSRVGASLAVYLLPIAIEAYGTNTALLLTAIFPLAGLLASLIWAPETKGKGLV